MVRRPLLLALAALTSCAGPLAAHRENVAHAALSKGTLSIRVVHGNLRVLTSGELADEHVTWMVDTGASQHSITPKQAARRALVNASAPPTENLGVAGWEDVETTHPVTVSALDVRRQEAITVTEPDDGLDDAHVVGILSPERLVSQGGAVELDLVRSAMFRLGGAEVERANNELLRAGARLEASCLAAGECIPTVHVTVADRSATLIVDTGAPLTVLFSDSDPGAVVATHATSHVYEWADSVDDERNLALVPNARIRVGTRAIESKHVAVMARPDGFGRTIDGMLGMDVLRGCALLLDGTARGAIACDEPTGNVDTAPSLGRLRNVPTPRLAPSAPALPPGVVARLGCETISDADLAAWANARDLPLAQAGAAMVRQRTVTRIVTDSGFRLEDAVRDDQVDLAITSQRVALHLEDDAAFDAELARHHSTRKSYRLRLVDQLMEAFVTRRLLPDPRLPERTLDALVRRTQDRLARVVVAREGRTCTEQWPRYWSEQLAFEGLSPADERAVRMQFARWMPAGVVVTALGTAWDVAPAVSTALHRDARVAFREDGALLHLVVTGVSR